MKTYRIAVIPGDGIGKEVVPEGVRALEAAGRKFGIGFKWDEYPWSCEYRARHGRMMPEDALDAISHHDAIVRAIETVLTAGPRTPDIGGKASTQETGQAIAEAI